MPPGGALHITFKYPTSAIGRLYEQVAPILLVDGVQTDAHGWTERQLPLASGPHRVEVQAPLAIPRRRAKAPPDRVESIGRAERHITVSDGEVAALEYYAPRSPASPGSLRSPGEPAQPVRGDWRPGLRNGITQVVVGAVLGIIIVLCAYVLIRVL